MTENLEKRRYSISQSGKFKQKYKQRQQISVELYNPNADIEQPKTPSVQRRATFSNLPSFIADHLCNQTHHQATDTTKSHSLIGKQTTTSKTEDTTKPDKSIVFEANL